MEKLQKLMKAFVREQEGQDLIEYTLLLCFVCLASAALFIGAGNSTSGIWNTASSTLTKAASAAAGGGGS